MAKFLHDRVENNVRKRENAGFPECFQKATLLGLLKRGLCGKGLMHLQKVSAHVSLYDLHGL